MSSHSYSKLVNAEEPPIISPELVSGDFDYEAERAELRRQLSDTAQPDSSSLAEVLCIACFPFSILGSWIAVNQSEEIVMMNYGKYTGTIRDPGIHWANQWGRQALRISTKQRSIELPKTTVVDSNGNPLIISAVIVFSVQNSRRAVLNVENVNTFVQSQAEASLKQTLSRFPYESRDGSPCLKTEAEQISNHLSNLLQRKVIQAGTVIHSFQLKEISYAPEIAAGMLKRQQAIAIIDARQTIVQGAVDIAVDAIEKLGERGISLDAPEKARLVTNLLTVVCSENDTQPTVPL